MQFLCMIKDNSNPENGNLYGGLKKIVIFGELVFEGWLKTTVIMNDRFYG